MTTFSVGDDVFGFGRGAFAEYALVADDRLAHKPPTLSFEHAATLPVSGVTALQAVHDHGHVQESQHVLVTGASGGVGSFAVQLAKAAGAYVTGVCSPGKADFVRSLGADDIVDHTRQDFADGSRRYDVIIDLAGNPTLARLRRALTPHGAAVLTGGESGGSLTGGMNRQLPRSSCHASVARASGRFSPPFTRPISNGSPPSSRRARSGRGSTAPTPGPGAGRHASPRGRPGTRQDRDHGPLRVTQRRPQRGRAEAFRPAPSPLSKAPSDLRTSGCAASPCPAWSRLRRR